MKSKALTCTTAMTLFSTIVLREVQIDYGKIGQGALSMFTLTPDEGERLGTIGEHGQLEVHLHSCQRFLEEVDIGGIVLNEQDSK